MIDLEKLVRKNIQDLKAYSSARSEFTGSEGVFLDANESPFGSLNRYPDPYQRELKSLLAERYELKSNQIFVGNGSDEAIDLFFRIFCEPQQDRAMVFYPSYGMYEVSAAINAVDLVRIPLTSTHELDLVRIVKEQEKDPIKLTFICSPNNPTGNAFDREGIKQVLENAKGIVVVDEAYIDFSSEHSLIDWIDRYPHLVVTQTMSKARGLAAARVGFAFANEQTIGWMNKVKPPYNVSSLNQQAAIRALKDESRYQANVTMILCEREIMKERLGSLSSVLKIYPSEANFLLVEFKEANKTYDALIDRKIIVRNRHHLVKNCIRITIGNPEENNRLIKELKQLEDEKSIVY